MRGTITRGLLLTTLAAPATGCFFVTEEEDVTSPGTLTVAYTIEGRTDPALCGYYRVSDAELVVYTVAGSFVIETERPCPDFFVRVRLYPGTYRADVTLVDRVDRARSITKPLQDIRVFEDTEVVIDVDFPRSSML